MTTDLDIYSRKGEVRSTDDRARAAVTAFRRLQPTLSAYARVLTNGKHTKVEMSVKDNGSTDGKTIYYRPPLALGDDPRHNRAVCDKRDSKKLLLCPACRVREEILVTIYHEIAHIAFKSFAKTDDYDIKRTIEVAVRSHGSKVAKRTADLIDAAPYWKKDNYINLASLVSPFFPFLVNCLEDARVNSEMFKARPGTKKMFDASTYQIFSEGVEQPDGRMMFWRDYPINAQVMIGCFAIVSGYEYSSWLHPTVAESLGDSTLQTALERARTVRSAKGAYQVAFDVYVRLCELGYCDVPEPDEPESSDDGDSEQGDEPDENSSSGGEDEAEQDSGDSLDSSGPEGTGVAGDERGDESSDASDTGEASDDGDSRGADGRPDDAESGGGSGPDDDGESTDESGPTGFDGDDETRSTEGRSDDSGGAPLRGDGSDEADETDFDESDEGTEPSDSTPADSDEEQQSPESGDSSGRPDDGGGGSADRDVVRDEGSPEESGDSDGDSSSDAGYSDDDSGEVDESDSDPWSDSEDRPDESDGGLPTESREADGDLEGDAPSGENTADGDRSLRDSDDAECVGSDHPVGEKVEGDQPVDTGADEGLGGATLLGEESDPEPLPEYGTADEVEAYLQKLGHHDHMTVPERMERQKEDEKLEVAIVQGMYFETPSKVILGVREHTYGNPIWIKDEYGLERNFSEAWDHDGVYAKVGMSSMGISGDFYPSESIMGQTLLKMRRAFEDNARGGLTRNQKSGRVDARVLGKRAFHNDERLFRRKVKPGKRDYHVIIGLDVSGSQVGENLMLTKRAAMAQAMLCHRLGISFSVYAHSGNVDVKGYSHGLWLEIYHVKDANEPWSDETQKRLTDLAPSAANLDGHTLEFYRKRMEEVRATDKIIMYYTDGKMPAENYDEELEILQRELHILKKQQVTVMGVGIRTDSPIRHGLDTVQVDTDEDLIKVVGHLEKVLR